MVMLSNYHDKTNSDYLPKSAYCDFLFGVTHLGLAARKRG